MKDAEFQLYLSENEARNNDERTSAEMMKNVERIIIALNAIRPTSRSDAKDWIIRQIKKDRKKNVSHVDSIAQCAANLEADATF